MTNRLQLLLLIAFSTLLGGCSSSFNTTSKQPDGTSIVLVASESEIMTATYDAISSRFSSDNINKLPSPQIGYEWSHWFGGNPGRFEITFNRVTGDTKDKVRVIGWGFEVYQSATGIDYSNDMGKLISALQYSHTHNTDIKMVRARNVRPATEAEIKAANSVAVKSGSGTGFFVTADGYLLTNNHVIADANRIDVHASNGNIYRAKVIIKDPNNDVALLKVEAQTIPLSVEQTSTLQKGSEIFTLGYPMPSLEGNAVKATFGRVNALSGIQDDIRFFQMDVPIQPGNSGGPLIDNNGAVVGIATKMLNQQYVMETANTVAQNVNYAVKSEYFITLLKYAKVNLPQVKPVHEAIKSPSQFEPSVVQVVASQEITP